MIDVECFIKLLNLYYNMHTIKMFLEHIQTDWQSWTIKGEYEILQKFGESARIVTIIYAGGMYGFGSFFTGLAIIPKIIGDNVTSPYSTRPVGFPYHVEYYIDHEKYYYPLLAHAFIATIIRLNIIVAKDTLVAILVLHCCTLFALTRYRLQYIRESVEQDKRLTFLKKDDKIYKNFVYCIQKHEDALQFANSMEDIFSKAFLFEVGIITINLSMTVLQTTKVHLTPLLIIRYIGTLSTQLLHVFTLCWLGQKIIDESENVYISVYQGEWYETPLKSKKLLNVIMLRSTSPFTLSCGKIMVFSLGTFNAIIRTAASYFTVFNSV